jgi:putative ABC transport system ATP-binding protein
LFRGQPLEAYGDLARFRARELGFIFQSFHLVSVLTAVQNVQLPLFETPLRAAQREARGRELLERVGMAHRADYRAGKLSGGERQRVAIARALACDPSLLLADEPTGNLDSKTADEIIDLFRDLHASGKTILMVTHDAALASEADRTLTMHDGQLV